MARTDAALAGGFFCVFATFFRHWRIAGKKPGAKNKPADGLEDHGS